MKTRMFLCSSILLSVITTTARAQQATGGRYDEQIQQQATKVLNSKDKWKGITAKADDGIVLLEGSVRR